MGADARLFLFDYELYRGSVAPAFRRLMCHGAMDQWLLELLRVDEYETGIGERAAAPTGLLISILTLEFGVHLPNGEASTTEVGRLEPAGILCVPFTIHAPFTRSKAGSLAQ
jgi:hypothetical protein